MVGRSRPGAATPPHPPSTPGDPGPLGYAGYFRDPDGQLVGGRLESGLPPRPRRRGHRARLRPVISVVASPLGRSPVVPAPVRIGLAGYGLGGRYFHAPLIASAPDCEFLGVVTTSRERQRQVAEDLARPAFASLEDLASAGAEAVAISTPAATHVDAHPAGAAPGPGRRLRQAVRAGRGVGPLHRPAGRAARGPAHRLPEPPLGFGLPDPARAPGPGRTRHADRLRVAVRAVPAASPVRPRRAVAPCWTSAATWPTRPWSWPARSAGVYAEMHYRTDAAGLDDDVFVALTHESGVRSHLWGSWRQGAPGPRFRAAGTEGAYVIQDVDGQEARLRSGASPASERRPVGCRATGTLGTPVAR